MAADLEESNPTGQAGALGMRVLKVQSMIADRKRGKVTQSPGPKSGNCMGYWRYWAYAEERIVPQYCCAIALVTGEPLLWSSSELREMLVRQRRPRSQSLEVRVVSE